VPDLANPGRVPGGRRVGPSRTDLQAIISQASAQRRWPDGALVAGQQYGYLYDDIGNRKDSREGGDAIGAGLQTTSYTANLLNQYTSIVTPGVASVNGLANATNVVTVNGAATARQGEYWWKQTSVRGGTYWTSGSATNGYGPVSLVGVVTTETRTQLWGLDLSEGKRRRGEEGDGFSAFPRLCGSWIFATASGAGHTLPLSPSKRRESRPTPGRHFATRMERPSSRLHVRYHCWPGRGGVHGVRGTRGQGGGGRHAHSRTLGAGRPNPPP